MRFRYLTVWLGRIISCKLIADLKYPRRSWRNPTYYVYSLFPMRREMERDFLQCILKHQVSFFVFVFFFFFVRFFLKIFKSLAEYWNKVYISDLPKLPDTLSICKGNKWIFASLQTGKPASVAQLDAPSDWRPGGRGFNPRRGQQHSFVEIDHEIFSTVILSLPLIQEGQLSVSGERMCTILVNHLED